jgi:hypothetical protein
MWKQKPLPHSHSLDCGCGINSIAKTETDVYTKYLTLPFTAQCHISSIHLV